MASAVTLGVMFARGVDAAHARRGASAAASSDASRELGRFELAAGATVTDLGSSFLERLGNQASHGFGNAAAE